MDHKEAAEVGKPCDCLLYTSKLKREYDATNRWQAMALLHEVYTNNQNASSTGGTPEMITGLLYINENRKTLPEVMELSETALVDLSLIHI